MTRQPAKHPAVCCEHSAPMGQLAGAVASVLHNSAIAHCKSSLGGTALPHRLSSCRLLSHCVDAHCSCPQLAVFIPQTLALSIGNNKCHGEPAAISAAQSATMLWPALLTQPQALWRVTCTRAPASSMTAVAAVHSSCSCLPLLMSRLPLYTACSSASAVPSAVPSTCSRQPPRSACCADFKQTKACAPCPDPRCGWTGSSCLA